MNKKEIRDQFRKIVLKRDFYRCVICNYHPKNINQLDVHHIVDRHLMPFGGYCAANGITLCTDRCNLQIIDCHRQAESLHSTGISIPGYAPNDLYAKINSNYCLAYRESLSLEFEEIEVCKIMNSILQISEKEKEICTLLGEASSVSTWELSCDSQKENNFYVKAYMKGLLSMKEK